MWLFPRAFQSRVTPDVFMNAAQWTYSRHLGLMKVNRRALGHNDEMPVIRELGDS
jgi:hypothetical protein